MKHCEEILSPGGLRNGWRTHWHALFCAECRRARPADRKLRRGARGYQRSLSRAPVPLGLEAAVLRRVGLAPAVARRPPVRGRLATGLCAAMLLLLALSLPLLRRERDAQVTIRFEASARKHETGENANAHLPDRKRLACRLVSRPNSAVSLKPAVSTPARRVPTQWAVVLPQDTPVVHGRVTRRASDLVMADAGNPPRRDDIDLLNGDPLQEDGYWKSLPREERETIEARIRRCVPVRDDFITIPFPRLVSTSERQIAQAAESYKREAAIVDPRLSREVTCAYKATALSDLCDQLRAETHTQLAAGPSVADEKVTLFCEKMPLREVMRQLSRPFGYTWLRSKKEGGEYRYELVQDLKSQLLEEELRNRDRNEALLALDREMSRYQPYLGLSPEEARMALRTAGPEQKSALEPLARDGWGAIHQYFRLSPQDRSGLNAGEPLTFSEAPGPGEKPLPEPVAQGVLQSVSDWRVVRRNDGFDIFPTAESARKAVGGLPPAAVPELRARVHLQLKQSELGRYTLVGRSGAFTVGDLPRGFHQEGAEGPWAIGVSPSVSAPENGAANVKLARDPALRRRVTILPRSSRPRFEQGRHVEPGGSTGPVRAPKVTTADVLEAVHQATGISIVADYYTRLYPPEAVSVKDRPFFEALNGLADTMRLRWNRDGEWLQLRSASYYNDRLKEVPNRLLAGWAASRQRNGALILDDLLEIAQLPDAQLDGADMAEGARECWGLAEWDLARPPFMRPHLRYLANLSPLQRREARSGMGLAFTRMSLQQQQQFISLGVGGPPVQSLEELAGSTLRVDYTQPGWFEWKVPGPDWSQWVARLEPGPRGRRVARPPVRERTREAALQALRRMDPQMRETILVETDEGRLREETQIAPTELRLAIIYLGGASNARPVHLLWGSNNLWLPTE